MVARKAWQRLFLALVLWSALSACAVARSPQVVRVALLGPFEGRYREVGYNALYAARLALREGSDTQPDLLAVDDGGTLASAVTRAEALALDPQVQAVIAVGYHAADPATQAALGDLPVIIPGNWTQTSAHNGVFLLASPALNDELSISALVDVVDAANAPAPLVGGDVLALAQFPRLRDSLDGVTLFTSGQLPADDFAARYQNGEAFAPEPNAHAMLTYDATALVASGIMRSLGAPDVRAAVSEDIAQANYEGLTGRIRFTDGIWQDAPIHVYGFDESGELVAVENLIEER